MEKYLNLFELSVLELKFETKKWYERFNLFSIFLKTSNVYLIVINFTTIKRISKNLTFLAAEDTRM